MIILTGGAGFVGSNILKRLNQMGEDDIVVVDNLRKSDKYRNLVGTSFRDYIDKEEFLQRLSNGDFTGVRGIIHEGACTDTMEYDGKYMLANNFEYSKQLLNYCVANKSRFIYASSAAVYGHTELACESDGTEAPLNVYGYSKLLFDQYVKRVMPHAQSTIVGLRYFNVYGPGESHKGKMSSMVVQFYNQIMATGSARLFGGYGAYGPGQQTRDFVYVKDIVDINLHFWERDVTKTIVNAGSGRSRTWNDLANAVIAATGCGKIEYIDFPTTLADKYQFNTRADLSLLRSHGFTKQTHTLEEGVVDYIGMLQSERQLALSRGHASA
ncbi:MAG: ADP-glyceromanno-heptose 6-epimerase [Fimbriimonas sp.]|nr:ADP-glyceromanno-heptose 6-epimerase [Fimbriimonas sp.]